MKIIKLVFSLFAVTVLGSFIADSRVIKAADTETITMSTEILEYMTMRVVSGSPVAFGSFIPGNAQTGSAGVIVGVTSNAANGYTLGISDGVASTNSALLHTDTTTRIPDYAGSVATPTSWTGTGLGITLYAADTSKNTTTWGSGTTYNDAANKYAGIPQAATVAHTVTGYHASEDTSSWGFKIDVPNTQKTGSYSGNMTFTATGVFS